jgi:hypothetical protein
MRPTQFTFIHRKFSDLAVMCKVLENSDFELGIVKKRRIEDPPALRLAQSLRFTFSSREDLPRINYLNSQHPTLFKITIPQCFLHLGVCRSIGCYLTTWYCILFELASALAALLTHPVTMGLSGYPQSSISISSYPPKNQWQLSRNFRCV